MKRLMSGALLLGAVLVSASCSNVTGDLAKGPTSITVDHNPLLITKHKTGLVVVQNLDDQGSPLVSAATAGTPTGPIAVVVDTTFQHAGVHYGTQFIASGTDFGVGLVTFQDAGLTTPNDTIIVLPNDTNPVATLSNTTPAIGDTLTFTVPNPFRLDTLGKDGKLVIMSVPTGLAPPHDQVRLQVVGLSADSLTITFIAPDTLNAGFVAHLNAPVQIQNSHYQYSPTYPWGALGNFAVQSSGNLVTP